MNLLKPLFIVLLITFSFTLNSYAQEFENVRLLFSDQKLNLPQRSVLSPAGEAFLDNTDTLSYSLRESRVLSEISNGNVPDFLRTFRKISYERMGHKIEFYCLVDYLSIGKDGDFMRMPMAATTAQSLADLTGCILPTSLLVDVIASAAEGHIAPFPFRPLGERNMKSITFEDSNRAINALLKAGGYNYDQLITGLKKDVILSNKIYDADRYRRIVIYGWQRLDGTMIQPVFNKHVDWYVDYSHGIRLIRRDITIDGKSYDLRAVIEDPELFKLVSNEDAPMQHACYPQ